MKNTPDSEKDTSKKDKGLMKESSFSQTPSM